MSKWKPWKNDGPKVVKLDRFAWRWYMFIAALYGCYIGMFIGICSIAFRVIS